MTTLLALYDEKAKTAWMASDGRATAGGAIISDAEEKMFIAGPWILGHSGTGRAGTLLHDNLTRLAGLASVEEIREALREILLGDQWRTVADSEGRAQRFGEWFLVASSAGLWSVCSEFSQSLHDSGVVFGKGSGGAAGQGAAKAFLLAGYPPEKALRCAVDVAATCDLYSGGRVTVCRADRTAAIIL